MSAHDAPERDPNPPDTGCSADGPENCGRGEWRCKACDERPENTYSAVLGVPGLNACTVHLTGDDSGNITTVCGPCVRECPGECPHDHDADACARAHEEGRP
jgi:hypothetical protein